MLAEIRAPESVDEDDYQNTDRTDVPVENRRERVKLEALQGRLESTLSAWDDHVRGCGVCLSQGQDLCYEGQCLAEDAGEIRGEIEELTAEPKPPRAPFFGPMRRPFFPGVPA